MAITQEIEDNYTLEAADARRRAVSEATGASLEHTGRYCFDPGEARVFGDWVTKHIDAIKEQAESSTRTGRLRDIERYSASKYRFLRFNFESGDAAGQNMSGRATAAA